MITAVDTNVLLDILAGEEAVGHGAAGALPEARRAGALVATDVVRAETAARFTFLVGTHALTQADRLLSRDRGSFRSHVTTLVVIDPSVGTP